MAKQKPEILQFDKSTTANSSQINDITDEKSTPPEQAPVASKEASQFDKMVVTSLQNIYETYPLLASEYEEMSKMLEKNSVRKQISKRGKEVKSSLTLSEQIQVFKKIKTLNDHVKNLIELHGVVLTEMLNENQNHAYDNLLAIGAEMEINYLFPLNNNCDNLQEKIFEQFRISIDKHLKQIEKALKASTLEPDPVKLNNLQVELDTIKNHLIEINQSDLFSVFNFIINRLDKQIGEHQKAYKTISADLDNTFDEIENRLKELYNFHLATHPEDYLENFHEYFIVQKNDISKSLLAIRNEAYTSENDAHSDRYMNLVDAFGKFSNSLENRRIEFLTSIENEAIAFKHMRKELAQQKDSWDKSKDRIDALVRYYYAEAEKFLTDPALQKHKTAADKIALIDDIFNRMIKNKEIINDSDFLIPENRENFPQLLTRNRNNFAWVNQETEQHAEDIVHLIEELKQIRKELRKQKDHDDNIETLQDNLQVNIEPENKDGEVYFADLEDVPVTTPHQATLTYYDINEELDRIPATNANMISIPSLEDELRQAEQANSAPSLADELTEIGELNFAKHSSTSLSEENASDHKEDISSSSFKVENLNERNATITSEPKDTPLHANVGDTPLRAIENSGENDDISKTKVRSNQEQPTQLNQQNNLKQAGSTAANYEWKQNNQLRMVKSVEAILKEIKGEREKRGIKRVYRKFVNFLLKLISPRITRRKENAFKELKTLLIKANKTNYDASSKLMSEEIKAWRKKNTDILEQRRGILRFFKKTAYTSSLQAVDKVINHDKNKNVYIEKANIKSSDLKKKGL